MGTININNVRESVISTLKQNFSNTKIYGEEIKQSFEEPCFFVKLFPVSHDQELGLRYKRSHSFDIHYFPVSATSYNEEMHGVAESLYGCLEYITVSSSKYRGQKMKHEIIDGVLHFFVNYVHLLRKEATEDVYMQTLTQEEGIKS